jgi:3-hydroxyethyl bacteriochlorophyllide a dehydrogenase
MAALAVVIHAPEQLEVRRLALTPPRAGELVVEVEWSGISTGTERLLWSGRMPPFPGLGYPLVPGYESVGRVVQGDPAARVIPVSPQLAEQGVLLALAATAQHALGGGDGRPAELIVGHGVLGRLLARLSVSAGGAPVVWENNPVRADGALGYKVIDPREDSRHDYRSIYDVSGDAKLIEPLLGRLARGGELVLAGFYSEPISFPFPLAFLKEARLRVAAEWQRPDLEAVNALIAAGRLPLDGLITHRRPFDQAAQAYSTAFTDPLCLKMLLDWRARS